MTLINIGEFEKRDINDHVSRILRDLGNPEPPLRLEDVRSLLSLDLQYYNSADPGLIQDLTHRFTILARKKIPDAGRHLMSALLKSKLCAFWLPDDSKILVDVDVPKLKHRWIEAHEISHSITPWHSHFLLGDNTQTLDPECHATLEAEANYGAGRLLFLQDRFATEARDMVMSFDSIRQLAKRYNNSIVSTFWRAVEERNPSTPVFGMISVHPHHPDVGSHDGPDPWRYFIRSPAFHTQFSNVSAACAFEIIRQYAGFRKTGPIFHAEHIIQDILGNMWEFNIESFSTMHALLTYGIPIRHHTPIIPVI